MSNLKIKYTFIGEGNNSIFYPKYIIYIILFFIWHSQGKYFGSRNKHKSFVHLMKEDKKVQNNISSASVTNISNGNKKIIELTAHDKNNMNKTISDSLYKKIDTKKRKSNIKIMKNISLKKNINYNNFTKEMINKKQLPNLGKIYPRNEDNNYRNVSVENEKVSMQIFDDLDKIRETLLENYKNNIQIKEKKNKENNKQNLTNNKMKYNEVTNYFNEDDNKNSIIPTKNRTSINFYSINQPINSSFDNSNNLNTHYIHKRLKSTGDNKPQYITRYLDRRKINDIPVTYPLYLSYNNKYKSASEKNRVDKILNKFICLKTHLLKDPLNKVEIIKEFFLKNGFNKDIYYTKESINNFDNYLKQPFSFPPEYNLSEVINDAINFEYDKSKDKEDKKINELILANFLNYIPKSRKWEEYEEISPKKSIKDNSMGKQIIYNLFMEGKFKRRYLNYDKFKNKTLPTLVKDLEYELRQIKIDKIKQIEKYNDFLYNIKIPRFKLSDNNKYVPNLCLVSKGFKERCKSVVDRKNRKILKYVNKQDYIKKINNRLYYDIIRKNNLNEFDRNDIQRKMKLTELIVMERAKKKLLYEKAEEDFKNSLKKIGKNK